MAENVRQRLGTDWGIATTGYAGRNNVQEQAVEDGLFYVHVAGKNCSRGSKFQTEGLNRQANVSSSTFNAKCFLTQEELALGGC